MELQSVEIQGRLARNARFEAPTCLVTILWSSCGSPCLWGKLHNFSVSKVSKKVVMRVTFYMALAKCIA